MTTRSRGVIQVARQYKRSAVRLLAFFHSFSHNERTRRKRRITILQNNNDPVFSLVVFITILQNKHKHTLTLSSTAGDIVYNCQKAFSWLSAVFALLNRNVECTYM